MSSEEPKLTGRTLLVYMYLLKNNKVTAREVKENLGFSSQSLAIYYLEKLYQMDFIDKEAGGYYVLKKKIDVGIYSFFTNLYGFLLPKFFPYAAFFTALLSLYLFFNFPKVDIFTIVILIISSSIFWYESIKLYIKYKKLVKIKKQ